MQGTTYLFEIGHVVNKIQTYIDYIIIPPPTCRAMVVGMGVVFAAYANLGEQSLANPAHPSVLGTKPDGKVKVKKRRGTPQSW